MADVELSPNLVVMTFGSFARGALAECSETELEQMLALDESLFVEHKKDIGENSGFQIEKAVTSFANTLGGWLLIGVQERQPYGSTAAWTSGALVDVVRDKLRGRVDPLPPFEARVMYVGEKPVGVVRIYESSDTPHVIVSTGSVFVREVAGDTDARRMSRAADRVRYEPTEIRSRAQLIELAQRGQVAAARVRGLIDRRDRAHSLVEKRIGLRLEQVTEHDWQPIAKADFGSIIVRVAPYTVPARFRAWTTTAEGFSATLNAAETLSKTGGLSNDWAKPFVNGVSVSIGPIDGIYHQDVIGKSLGAEANVALEANGVVGAALHLEVPDDQRLRPSMGVFEFADSLVAPPIEATIQILRTGEFLGRALCHIDLVALGGVLALEEPAANPAQHVEMTADLTLPADPDELRAVARLAGAALGRSAGLQTWDPPQGMHNA